MTFTGHAETAHNRIASVVLGFKEALLEEAEKKKDKQKFVHQRWKFVIIISTQNILLFSILQLESYCAPNNCKHFCVCFACGRCLGSRICS